MQHHSSRPCSADLASDSAILLVRRETADLFPLLLFWDLEGPSDTFQLSGVVSPEALTPEPAPLAAFVFGLAGLAP